MLTGIQALVRMLLTQRRLDVGRGLNTGMFVSGYPGSPLGGLDLEIGRNSQLLSSEGVVFQPGVNEELAATAVWGTQLLSEVPGRRCDGIVGVWYGKSPGLDRASDAIRHANLSGTSNLGGAVALIGDDPMCKSSTVPGASEAMCRSLMMPLLAPSSVHEIVELGLHAVALSRAAGVWVGMKITADVADSSATVTLGGEAAEIPYPPRLSRGKPPTLLAATSLDAEHDLSSNRLDRVKDYAKALQLNRIIFEPASASTAVVAAGATYATLKRALRQAGIDDAGLDTLGVRLVQVRMPWPLSAEDASILFGGVERVIVVEDKQPFLESQIKELLYGVASAPEVFGKYDRQGATLFTSYASLDADHISAGLARVLPVASLGAAVRHKREPSSVDPREPVRNNLLASRTPFFCSGCPHNISTKAPADQLVGAGIGCHALVSLDPGSMRGTIIGAPQMGGEGAHWVGLAPFTSDKHFVQNLGDGTFFHSGSLAVRAAVAAGVHMTYKLLYNDAVAMTGGQTAEGHMNVPELTRWLALEGVTKVVITTVDLKGYESRTLDPIASVRHRDEYTDVEAELAATDGVTVIIHDDRCATEERRMRKRGLLPAVTRRVWINERVCEGCGDCGEKSTCLSVVPVETPFGRKTQIHQASCNSDMSCLKGDCPSFVMVEPGSKGGKRRPPALRVSLVDPTPRALSSDYLIRMPGVGGTGVVTVSQILQMAAMLDNKHSGGLDQTGLAQKGGPVVSDVRVSETSIDASVRATSGEVDLLLGLDALSAASASTLATCNKDTIAIINTSVMATAAMVVDATAGVGNADEARSRIDAATSAEQNAYLDATRLSEALFGDHMPANLIMVGAAYQRGCIPISWPSIKRAIELNRNGVETNLEAFAWGRAAVIDPDAVAVASGLSEPAALTLDPRAEALVASALPAGRLADSVATRLSDLIGYQSVHYASDYLRHVVEVFTIETRALGEGHDGITNVYARSLHRLMAYKDEYEVARLHLLGSEQARLRQAFGPNAKTQVLLLPPLLRSLGMNRKIAFGAWFRPVLKSLAAGRRLRGSSLDPFGRSAVRKLERALITEYRAIMADALARLRPETEDAVLELAGLPDIVRGYEDVKLRNVERYRARVAEVSVAT